MSPFRLSRGAACALIVASLLGTTAHAQAPAPAGAAGAAPAPLLFAVEFRTGPAWDKSKSPGEQAHFRDHSSNLKKLRDQGSLVLGARYADKGLVVLQAASADEAHAMVKLDPAVQAGVFAYELHPFNVFYGGAVAPRARN